LLKSLKLLLTINKLNSELVLPDEHVKIDLPRCMGNSAKIDQIELTFKVRQLATSNLAQHYELNIENLKRFLTTYGLRLSRRINSLTIPI